MRAVGGAIPLPDLGLSTGHFGVGDAPSGAVGVHSPLGVAGNVPVEGGALQDHGASFKIGGSASRALFGRFLVMNS
jgi:hypothetical protein